MITGCIQRRWIAVGALVAVALISSCVPQPKDRTEDGRIIVSYWEKWTGFEGEAMQAVVDDFNASQNRIFVKRLAVSAIDQKLMLSTAGGNPPDVAGLWSHSVPDFAEKGALTPLNKILEKAGITRDDYIGVFWDLCEHRGFIWALPATAQDLALHWNKRMFREAGLDPDTPPRTLDELDRMAEQLTVVEVEREGKKVRVRYPDLTDEEKQAKNFSLIQLGHIPAEPGWYREMWGYWFGGDLWNGKDLITANSPENLAAAKWQESYPLKYGLNNIRAFGASFGNFASPQNPFLEGRVAMVLQGVWMYNFIDKYAPHLDWAVAPFPSIDPERLPNVTLVESDVLMIPNGARHPREAFEFIHYVNTQGPMERLCLGQRKFTPLKQVSPMFIENHPNPNIRLFAELARSPNARYVPRLTVWREYKDEMLVAIDRVAALSASPEDALAEVQQRVQWRFDRILRRWNLIEDERLKEWSEYDAW
ncbi:MAG: ABC transporter substrate-binding protein [Verrucomicrobia bacterium]|nr:ABC transporter substrate-binding protein [Verrucomicrobiota bacterium]